MKKQIPATINGDSKLVGVVLDKDARLPVKVYSDDVGHDLYALEDCIVPPGQFVEVHTGVHLVMPEGIYATVNTRSGHGAKGIMCHAGTIDPGFTGEVLVWVYNVGAKAKVEGLTSKEPFQIKKGDRIAQLVFHKSTHVTLTKVKTIPETKRGQSGYGSSGN